MSPKAQWKLQDMDWVIKSMCPTINTSDNWDCKCGSWSSPQWQATVNMSYGAVKSHRFQQPSIDRNLRLKPCMIWRKVWKLSWVRRRKTSAQADHQTRNCVGGQLILIRPVQCTCMKKRSEENDSWESKTQLFGTCQFINDKRQRNHWKISSWFYSRKLVPKSRTHVVIPSKA